MDTKGWREIRDGSKRLLTLLLVLLPMACGEASKSADDQGALVPDVPPSSAPIAPSRDADKPWPYAKPGAAVRNLERRRWWRSHLPSATLRAN